MTTHAKLLQEIFTLKTSNRMHIFITPNYAFMVNPHPPTPQHYHPHFTPQDPNPVQLRLTEKRGNISCLEINLPITWFLPAKGGLKIRAWDHAATSKDRGAKWCQIGTSISRAQQNICVSVRLLEHLLGLWLTSQGALHLTNPPSPGAVFCSTINLRTEAKSPNVHSHTDTDLCCPQKHFSFYVIIVVW